MKMLIIFYLLLILSVGRCRYDHTFETKTRGVGEYVTLKCPCKTFQSLFWIRLIPGNLPEVLGKALNSEGVDSRITTTEESGAFVLRIKETKLSDTGVYFCAQMQKILTFLKRADLKVEEPGMTAVPSSDPVRPGGSVTVTQSSVPSDSENTTGPGDQTVCCFRSESNESHLSFTNIPGNNVEEYEKTSVILSLLCAALAISLIVIAFLIYSIMKLKRKSCGSCKAADSLQTHAATASVDHQSQQTEEDLLIYSAPTFTSRKTIKAETRDAKTDEEEAIYTNVRVELTA